ncbi:secretory lipase [Herbihabitans rhizosphaerae]|uniref:Secretory lipase n=1 Tax=Herbihabitans rhizosphaerae TaxID=1872711 RepID=A0A4Q7KQY8_9PSEU|nr:lipase family protein [Herbihabitans rhizosphaerae]RZS38884.1 secretory lipase [Herbihabitans rhizosphaerae]
MRKIALAVVGVALAVLGLVVGVAPGAAESAAVVSVPEPDDDPFFRPAPGYESAPPGTVLKKRQVSVPMPVTAYQFQVRTNDAKDNPATVVSTLLVPPTPYPLGKRPLLSYQPAIDSLGDQCNPSYTLRTGTEKEAVLLGMGLAKGWAVVVTDYQGPRDAFAAGRMEGHGVLDGVRGALALPEAGLAGSPVGLWGYSGGALASGWAAELQPSYAPELQIKGVAAGGTPADPEAAVRTIEGGIGAGLAVGAIMGVMREYPELEQLMNDAGRELRDEVADLCVTDLTVRYPFRKIAEFTTSPDPLNEPVAKQVLALNTMGSKAPTAPVYLYHSLFDELVPHKSAVTVSKQWCAQGTKVKLYTDILSEHAILAVTGAPAAVAYLDARFLGRPAPSTCS